MTYPKLRNKIRDKKWVRRKLIALYQESRDIVHFETFECSDFFRGKTLAEHNRKILKKWKNQNERHIRFMERCK